jgi:WD40 repeat protein
LQQILLLGSHAFFALLPIMGMPIRKHKSSVSAARFSLSGTQIVSCSNDQIIATSGTTQHEHLWYKMHSKRASPQVEEVIAVSPDGDRIACLVKFKNGYGARIGIWDVQGRLWSEEGRGDPDIEAIAYAHDGKRIVSGSGSGALRVWDANSGVQLAGPFKHPQVKRGGSHSVAFSSDGRFIAGATSGSLLIVDLTSRHHNSTTLKNYSEMVTSIDFSRVGARIASASADGVVCVTSFKTEKTGPFGFAVKWRTDCRELEHQPSHFTSVAYSPNGALIAAASAAGVIRLWDAETGESTCLLLSTGGGLRCVAFSNDGAHIISGNESGDVIVWSV